MFVSSMHPYIVWVLFVCAAHAQNEFDIRLIGTDVPYAGQLSIFHNGEWGLRCPFKSGVYWNFTNHDVVCRQLGFSRSVTRYWSSANEYFGMPYVMDGNVTCTGTEERLEECILEKPLSVYNCGSTNLFQKIIFCWPLHEGDDLPLRLVGGLTPDEGRIETYFNGTWKSVCSSIGNWHYNTGQVVCRQLGYKYLISTVTYFDYGQGTVPRLIDVIWCDFGNESSILQCYLVFSHQSRCERKSGVRCSNFTPQEDFAVRLVDGNGRHEGDVEVYYNGTWGIICSDQTWDINEADVICRQFGYESAYADKVQSYGAKRSYSQGKNRKYVLNYTNCMGSERRLSDCHIETLVQEECRHNYRPFGVTCQVTRSSEPKNNDVRLNGGTGPWEGLLEVYDNGQWIGLCESFLGWSRKNAHVICHQLGYRHSLEKPNLDAFKSDNYNRHSQFIKDCFGLERNLVSCKNYAHAQFDCDYAKKISVKCSQNTHNAAVGSDIRITKRLALLGTGRVEVLVYNDTWYRVCNDNWNFNAATVVCKQLGFDYAVNTDYRILSEYDMGEYAVISYVNCSGAESQLSECRNTLPGMYRCARYKDATVMCRYNASPVLDPEAPVRLVNGSSDSEGLVQIFHDDKWWTICDSLWDLADAYVICSQLGFSNARTPFTRDERMTRFLQFDDDVGILMDGLDCRGSEGSLAECPHTRLGHHNCGHFEDVAVSCVNNTRSSNFPIRDYTVRLVGGTTLLEGRVEVYFADYYGVHWWATICSADWDMKAADVVCRQLNFSYALTAIKNSTYGELYGTKLSIKQIECTGEEYSIGMCKLNTWASLSPYCTHDRDAGVICSNKVPLDYDVRLIGGASVSSGQVQVFARGYWGTICTCEEDSCWSMQEAIAVCQSLGYEGAISADGIIVADLRKDDLVQFSALDCKDIEDLDNGASNNPIESCLVKKFDDDKMCNPNHSPKTVTCNSQVEDANLVEDTDEDKNKNVTINKLPIIIAFVILMVILILAIIVLFVRKKYQKSQEAQSYSAVASRSLEGDVQAPKQHEENQSFISPPPSYNLTVQQNAPSPPPAYDAAFACPVGQEATAV